MIGTGIWQNLLDFCYPWVCAGCDAAFEGKGPLCDGCFNDVDKGMAEPHCERCAMTLPMLGSPCPYCRGKGPAHFDRVARLGPYTGSLAKVIVKFKYNRRWGLGREIGQRLWAMPNVRQAVEEADVIMAVPLHWKRRLGRGYNQAEILARALAKAGKRPVVTPVRRVRNTPTQTHMQSRTAREKNLSDAFALVRPGQVAAKRVLLVDDVWTTGATLHSLAKALREAKPASLSAVVVATADVRGFERAAYKQKDPSV